MKLSDDTDQRRDVSILDATLPDVPVRVDTAMKAKAAEYQDIATRGDAWWRRVALLAARH